MIFLIATQNKHKKTEFSRILAPLGIEIKTAGELGLQYPDVEETGTTFEENALIKARAGCMLAGVPTLADDSGLCVDALDGAPGLYSARWSGDGETNGDDEANNDKLLRLLADVPDEQRTAHYVAAVAAVFPDGIYTDRISGGRVTVAGGRLQFAEEPVILEAAPAEEV